MLYVCVCPDPLLLGCHVLIVIVCRLLMYRVIYKIFLNFFILVLYKMNELNSTVKNKTLNWQVLEKINNLYNFTQE